MPLTVSQYHLHTLNHYYLVCYNYHLNYRKIIMFIAGLTLEKSLSKPKNNEQKSLMQEKLDKRKQKQDERPYSSQYKALEIKKSYTTATKEPMKSKHPKNYSQNKVVIKKNFDSQPKMVANCKRQSANHKKHAQDTKKSTKHIKKTSINLPKSPMLNLNLSPQDNLKLTIYFRYHPITILNVAGCKQNFLRELFENRNFQTIKMYKKPSTKKDISTAILKLVKNAQLKGKYKIRERFNYALSMQLKAINYKKKQSKKRKESSSSSSDDEVKEKCRDMKTWKKVMGVDGKVFIIKGKYPDLRKALLARGWTENEDKKSTFYDLRWTTKISDINFSILKPKQMVNHFDNNACLTSKYGIIKSLRSILYCEGIDIDKFFPKAFDMSDVADFQNFLEVYKWIYCQSILKQFLKNPHRLSLSKVKVALIVCQRRLNSISAVVSEGLQNRYALCSPLQWKFLISTKKQPEQFQSEALTNSILTSIEKIATNQINEMVPLVESALKDLQIGNGTGVFEPQFELNGDENIWIVKPAFLSRGRGIKCCTNLTEILDSSLGKQTQYVVQKYIQNPLIINNRKFDIRVWVLVEDFCPPKIWFYNPFYVRFCLQEYNPAQLKNRYAHLTNNSVQKYNKRVNAKEITFDSMWDKKTFQEYIESNYSKEAFSKIISQMKQIVIATILGTCDQVYGRPGSFELIGYDMMIDENLNTWLIEINSSPAMDYSTNITRVLVASVMEDITKVVVDLRQKNRGNLKGTTAGEFKCIYSGGNFKVKNYGIKDKQQKQQTKRISEMDELKQEGKVQKKEQ